MKIKTSELTGPALDWAVAKANTTLYPLGYVRLFDGNLFTIEAGDHEHSDKWQKYDPSTNWAQGGPIIELNGIQLHVNEDRTEWIASCWGIQWQQYGPTPLIAAMRLFVASKLGDEVEVPDELV